MADDQETTNPGQVQLENVNLDEPTQTTLHRADSVDMPQNESAGESQNQNQGQDPQQLLWFRPSSIPQHPELRKQLEAIRNCDQYNRYCFDCHTGETTHALLTYGVLVCVECARLHFTFFGGRVRSGIKDLFNEQWDDFQIESISPPFGGNLLCYSFLYEYKYNNGVPIRDKYTSTIMKYYVRMMQARLDRRLFREEPPKRDWFQSLSYTQQKVQGFVTKYEQKMNVFGSKINQKIEQKGWFKGIIGKKAKEMSNEQRQANTDGFVQDENEFQGQSQGTQPSGNRFSNIFKRTSVKAVNNPNSEVVQYDLAQNQTDMNIDPVDAAGEVVKKNANEKYNLDDVTNLYDDSTSQVNHNEDQVVYPGINGGEGFKQRRI